MGVNVAAFVAGGLLKGFGQGVVDDAKASRDRALRQLELDAVAQRTAQEIEARHKDIGTEQTGATTRVGMEGQNRKEVAGIETGARKDIVQTEQKGAMARTQVEAGIHGASDTAAGERTGVSQAVLVEKPDGTLIWSYPDGSTHAATENGQPLKGRKAGAPVKDTEGTSASDMRDIGIAKDRAGIMSGIPVTGPRANKLAQALDEMGRRDLAAKYDASFAAGAPVGPAKRSQPDTAAAAMPSNQAAPTPTQVAPSASGQGTQDNPYQPSSQADVSALPTGAVFRNPADGKLYRKK